MLSFLLGFLWCGFDGACDADGADADVAICEAEARGGDFFLLDIPPTGAYIIPG